MKKQAIIIVLMVFTLGVIAASAFTGCSTKKSMPSGMDGDTKKEAVVEPKSTTQRKDNASEESKKTFTYSKPNNKPDSKPDTNQVMQEIIKKSKSLEITIDRAASGTPRLNEQNAIRRAKQILGPFYSKQAKEILVQNAFFTDAQIGKHPVLKKEIKHLSVWIVTFKGVKMKRHGQKSGQINSIHVVIDANSGEEIEMYSYE